MSRGLASVSIFEIISKCSGKGRRSVFYALI